MNNEVKIITNYHWREFIYLCEMSEADQMIVRNQFDWIDESEIESTLFMNYHDRWYALDDFMSLHNKIHSPNPPDFMDGWDGYLNDTYFSGVLIKVSEECDFYQIATFY